MAAFEFDADSVLDSFKELTGKEMERARLNAVRNAAQILVKATRQRFRAVTPKYSSKNWWNGKSLISGISIGKPNKKEESIKVHIMGDFRLKFWELGTKERTTKKDYIKGEPTQRGTARKKASRAGRKTGSIKQMQFFEPAQQESEKRVFDEMENLIAKNITKIANKK